jgi:hypothetical protein
MDAGAFIGEEVLQIHFITRVQQPRATAGLCHRRGIRAQDTLVADGVNVFAFGQAQDQAKGVLRSQAA